MCVNTRIAETLSLSSLVKEPNTQQASKNIFLSAFKISVYKVFCFSNLMIFSGYS